MPDADYPPHRQCFRCHRRNPNPNGADYDIIDYDGELYVCVPCNEYMMYRRNREEVVRRNVSEHVCKCGHTQGRHDGQGTCRSHDGRSFCPCLEYREVWMLPGAAA